MAKGFKALFNKLIYEDEQSPGNDSKSNLTKAEESIEQPSEFEGVVSTDSDVSETARSIIEECQRVFDPATSISRVQEVLELLGPEAEALVVQRVLAKITGCDLTLIKEDGIARREAIKKAIGDTKTNGETLRQTKAQEEIALKEAEKEAEKAYTDAVNTANQECELAIQEERTRCEIAIEEIRKSAEETISAAKKTRDASLSSISMQRESNETCLRQSAALVAETEKTGNDEIGKINKWLESLL